MKYILTIHAIGSFPIIEISKEEYESCKNAKMYLLEALHIEEKMNIVIENYREFEQTLLDLTLRYILYHDVSWSVFNEERNQINRKLANLLTACRMYLDHLIRHMNNIFGKSSHHINEIKKVISSQYDAELGYRVMEALRNYIQHRGFAISSLTHNSEWNEERTYITDTLIPSVSTSELEADPDFKRSVIEEIKVIGSTIDIKPFVRTYVASLAVIQDDVRRIIKGYSQSWESSIDTLFEKYPRQNKQDKDPTGLVAAIMSEDGCYGEIIYMFREYIQRWKRLERLNSNIKNLPKRKVTNI